MTRAQARVAGLYAIADYDTLRGADLGAAVEAAIQGGARLIQYRDKHGDAARRRRNAALLLARCRRHGVPLILNDDLALAAELGADGVHLGRDDLSVRSARAALGAQALIGASCYNELTRAHRAAAGGADYLAFGSLFPSKTKPLAVRADAGLLREARNLFPQALVAIGGITPENGAELIAAGADALAVIAGVFAQSDIAAAARRYSLLFSGRESSVNE